MEAYAIGKPRRRDLPLRLPFTRALAFGDAVVGVEDRLRVWDTLGDKSPDWYRARFLPTLEPLLELDPEHALVHGPPAIGDGRELRRRRWRSRPGGTPEGGERVPYSTV